MSGWLRFLALASGWSVLSLGLLQIPDVHPVAVGLVWIVGFLWLTGWSIEGRSGGDNLVKYTAGMFAGFGAIAAVLVGIITLLGG